MIDSHGVELRVAGAIVMALFALKIWRAHPHLKRSETDRAKGLKRSIFGALALTLMNPGVFLGLLAFFSAAGLSDLGATSGEPLREGKALILGIFLGAVGWWALLASSAQLLRDRINDRTLLIINRTSAICIGLFALAALISVFL